MIKWCGKQDSVNMGFLQRSWMLIYPLLTYEAVSTVILMFYMFFLMLTDPKSVFSAQDFLNSADTLMERVYENYVPVSLVICAVTIPLLLLFMHMDRRREERDRFRTECWEKAPLWSFGLVFVIGAAAGIVLNNVLLYSGLYDLLSDSAFEQVSDVLYTGNFWVEIAAVGIMTPIVEELLFRGLMYRRLRWFLDTVPAVVLSALTFALYHGNWLQGIYAFIMGILLAYVYERCHNVAAPAAVHIGANLLSVILTEWDVADSLYTEPLGWPFIAFTLVVMLVLMAGLYVLLTVVNPRRLHDGVSADSEYKWEDENGKRTV